MRSFLRADPDVIMVGEMRDHETAAIGIEASLTGHLVFSTLHTNSACESLTRLDDMGVEMFLIAGCLRAVVAQRLIRRICPQCKVPTDPEVMGLRELGLTADQIVAGRYFRGQGCNHCMNSGFKGRVAAYEVLFVDDEVRQLVRRRSPVEHVQEAAQRNGMKTMLNAATELVLQGLTTLEEVHRCIGAA